jgi:hypothetical protein
MTDNYDSLCQVEPIFRELRNVMDLSVVAAIITGEKLTEKVNLDIPAITDQQYISTPTRAVPETLLTQCSFVKIDGGWVITASGGINIDSWGVAANKEAVASLDQIAQTAADRTAARWWWNAN